MSNLAVLPARGGSKRLPRKNVLPLAGEPLIAHSIRAAVASGVFDKVVVSTDDLEIAEVARRYGAEVPFMREPRLADDHTPVSQATVDAVTRLLADGFTFDRVAQLMPNCPLRNADDVRFSLAAFDAQAFASQVSVTRYGWQNPWWALERGPDGAARPLFQEQLMRRSQDLPALFCPTGAVWWADTGALTKHGTFHLRERALFELPWHRAIDIDDADDFELATWLIGRHCDGPGATQ